MKQKEKEENMQFQRSVGKLFSSLENRIVRNFDFFFHFVSFSKYRQL